MITTEIPRPPKLQSGRFYELSEPFSWCGHTGRHVWFDKGYEELDEARNLGVFLCSPDGEVLTWMNILDWETPINDPVPLETPDWAWRLKL